MENYMQVLLVLLGAVISMLTAIAIEALRKPSLTITIETPHVDKQYPNAPAHEARFVRLRLVNEPLPWWGRWMSRTAALRCHGTINFCQIDGQDVFGRAMPVRWAGSPEPLPLVVESGGQRSLIWDPVRLSPDLMRDVYPGEPETFDVAARFDDDEECYGWNNESYFSTPLWRNPNWRLPKGRYLIRLEIISAGEKLSRVFRLVNDGPRNEFRIEPTSQEHAPGSSKAGADDVTPAAPIAGCSEPKREEKTMELSLKHAPEVLAAIALLGYLGYLAAYWRERGASAHFKFPEQFVTVDWPTALVNLFIMGGYVAIAGFSYLATLWLKEWSFLRRLGPRALFSVGLAIITLGLFSLWARYSLPSSWSELWHAPPALIWSLAGYVGLVFSVWNFVLLTPEKKDDSLRGVVDFIRKHRFAIMTPVLIGLIAWVFIWLPWKLGKAEASAEKGFWIPSAYPDSVVLRIYGDNLVCGGVVVGEDNTTTLDGDFFVIGPSENLTFNDSIKPLPPARD
jgi:hypothetical protein